MTITTLRHAKSFHVLDQWGAYNVCGYGMLQSIEHPGPNSAHSQGVYQAPTKHFQCKAIALLMIMGATACAIDQSRAILRQGSSLRVMPTPWFVKKMFTSTSSAISKSSGQQSLLRPLEVKPLVEAACNPVLPAHLVPNLPLLLLLGCFCLIDKSTSNLYCAPYNASYRQSNSTSNTYKGIKTIYAAADPP